MAKWVTAGTRVQRALYPSSPPSCPHPDPESEQGESCPLTVAPSRSIWAAQAGPLKTWTQGREGEARAGLFLLQDALQQLRGCSSLLSVGPDLCAHRSPCSLAGSGGESACSSVLVCVSEARDHMNMCRMWVCMYIACVCRTIYTHAACMQGCLQCVNAHLSARLCVSARLCT